MRRYQIASATRATIRTENHSGVPNREKASMGRAYPAHRVNQSKGQRMPRVPVPDGPAACSNCGSGDELWAWYSQPERQTIDVRVEGGGISFDYTGVTNSSSDAGDEEEFFCGNCQRTTKTIEEMVGLPPPAAPVGLDAWVRERARRGLDCLADGDVDIVREVLKALAEFRADDPIYAEADA